MYTFPSQASEEKLAELTPFELWQLDKDLPLIREEENQEPFEHETD